MIKIIIILFFLLLAYYLGLFLFRTMNKSKKMNQNSEPDVYKIDVPKDAHNPTEFVDVKEEMYKLDEKKNF